jgi:hypothetical protein
MMMPGDFKAAITEDVAEIELVLSVLNGLRNVKLARLALLKEAEARNAGDKEGSFLPQLIRIFS